MSIATHTTAKQLEMKLLQAVREKTKGRVGQLAITWAAHRVIIHGHTFSFYVAQLALSAAREVMRNEGDGRPVRTKIVVEPPKPRRRAAEAEGPAERRLRVRTESESCVDNRGFIRSVTARRYRRENGPPNVTRAHRRAA